MRILYVTSYYRPAEIYGGPVHSISSMCEALTRLGAEVTVLTTNANGVERLDVPLGQAVKVDGVEVYYYPIVAIPPRSFFYSPALARACTYRAAHFDLAVLDTLYTHAMGSVVVACTQARVPFVISLRGQLLPWAINHRRLKKRLYLALVGRHYLNSAAALHCTDPSEAEAVAGLQLKPPTFVVPNGIAVSRFARMPECGTIRQRLSIPAEATVLLFLGRLHRKKRPDIAVATLVAAQSLSREVHLVVAGPDEDQLTSALKLQAQHSGCTTQLHLVGLLKDDEVLSALADANLLLMPSERCSENFGMAAIEAMAAGVPVLVSDGVPVGRWAEQVGAGRIAPCTIADFSRAARQLLSAPEHLRVMGERGRELVRQQFDITIIARQMLAQYQAIATNGQPLLENALRHEVLRTSL